MTNIWKGEDCTRPRMIYVIFWFPLTDIFHSVEVEGIRAF